MNKAYNDRKLRLLPDGKPRWIRCYDNGGETLDRYTVVFTGHYTHLTGGEFLYVGMSSNPFHGIGQHGSSCNQIDAHGYARLGKKITFDELPEPCQQVVLGDYVNLWSITDHPLYVEY